MRSIANVWIGLALLVGSSNNVLAEGRTLRDLSAPYARILRSHFPQAMPIHGVEYRIAELPAVSKEIAFFQVKASSRGGALSVSGSVTLAPIPKPFEVTDSANGRRYMLHLQAYLFAPDGQLIWTQWGFPEDAWVSSDGGRREFVLIDSFHGSLHGCELIIIAAGDPVFSDSSETRVLLGLRRMRL
jgi:hypothetical protein